MDFGELVLCQEFVTNVEMGYIFEELIRHFYELGE